MRFAPSPNGALHLGHARSALLNAAMAKALGGRFLLRIEDIDLARARDVYVDWIYHDLAWLGLSWDGAVLRQSEHFARYEAAAQALRELGLLYPCFASRSEIAAAGNLKDLDPDGAPLYPGLWRGQSADSVMRARGAGLACAWRIDMAKAKAMAARKLSGAGLTIRSMAADGSIRGCPAQPERWGDAVIVRKETPTSYHLSVVVDDARQGITHVVRGQDLLAATDLHRLLQVLLDLPAPIYHHHPLLTDADGRKLSKSAGDISLRDLRVAGWTPADVITRALGM